jgi:hypothetical protein
MMISHNEHVTNCWNHGCTTKIITAGVADVLSACLQALETSACCAVAGKRPGSASSAAAGGGSGGSKRHSSKQPKQQAKPDVYANAPITEVGVHSCA